MVKKESLIKCILITWTTTSGHGQLQKTGDPQMEFKIIQIFL